MKRLLPVAALALLMPTAVNAQDLANIADSCAADSAIIAKYSEKYDSLSRSYAAELGVPIEEVSDNPLYFKLFMPLALYDEVFRESPEAEENAEDLLPLDSAQWKNDTRLAGRINRTLARVYIEHPELVEMTQAELMKVSGAVSIAEDAREGISQATAENVEIHEALEPELVKNKPHFWKFPGNSSFKYTQSSYSDNWYKGGENNHTLLVQLNQEANYAKNNLTFDNKLETKLGFYTSKSDDKTLVKSNEDLLRLTSKFGYKAAKSWYYSAQIQGYTQFLNVYEKDNVTLKSEFFGPAYGSVSVGMDYKPKFNNSKINLSAQLSPVAYNCRYVKRVELAPKYGIEENKNFKSSIGSRVEVNLKWNLFKNFTWTSKAQFFTSYANVEANFENTFDYTINKYFSIQFFFHWRFDDSVMPDGEIGYNQLKEFLTLNFNFNW